VPAFDPTVIPGFIGTTVAGRCSTITSITAVSAGGLRRLSAFSLIRHGQHTGLR